MKANFRLLIALLALPLLAHAKGPTTAITLVQPGKTPVVLHDEAVEQFRFGPGPGNFAGYPPVPSWQPKSWIVEDWEHPVSVPAGLPRIQASFTLTFHDGSSRDYVVFHAYDAAARQAFIYLPGKGEPHYDGNASLMRRGDAYDGHWFRATSEWTQRVRVALGQ